MVSAEVIGGAGVEVAARAGTEAESGAMAEVAPSSIAACLVGLAQDVVSLQCLQIHRRRVLTFPPILEDDYGVWFSYLHDHFQGTSSRRSRLQGEGREV